MHHSLGTFAYMPNGNVYPCCVTPMQHMANLNDNTLEEVFNSDLMKKIRVDMMNNVKSESCERCWKQEENGGTNEDAC